MAESPLLPAIFCMGHPPSMEWMTLKERLLASESVSVESVLPEGSIAMLTWHEPPPWTAEPSKARVWVEPMGITLTGSSIVNVVPRSLHGKSDPSAARGLLLSVDLSKGTGDVIMIWLLARAAKPRTVSVEKCMSKVCRV